MKKTKVTFMIYLIISLTFYLAISTNIVTAQTQNLGCCLEDNNGDTCKQTTQDNCVSDFVFTDCSNVNSCKPVCCITENECNVNVPYPTCLASNGIVNDDPSCISAGECKIGCCNLGANPFIASYSECQQEVSQYGLNVDEIFDSSIITERECLLQADLLEKGCCITDNGCSYTTTEECLAITNSVDNFNIDKLCSDPSLVSSCGCEEKSSKGCLLGDDVYWFDSCGNPEDITEECDIKLGFTCGQNEDGESACVDINCADTYADSISPKKGIPRKHGESWCEYEFATGDGLDRPGSRHFRNYCLDSQQYVEECADFRQQVCVQAEVKTDAGPYSEANCIGNDVSKTGVPLGFRFWKGEGKGVCDLADLECIVLYTKKNRFASWKCEENCECEKQSFIDEAAKNCRSLGDCGSGPNVFGQTGSKGFKVKWGGDAPGPKPTKPSPVSNQKKIGSSIKKLSEEYAKGFGTTQQPDIHGAFGNAFLTKEGLGLATGIGYLTSVAFFYSIGVMSEASTLAGAAQALFSFSLYSLSVFVPFFIIGVLIAAIILGGGDSATKTVKINCDRWEPPKSGNCERCNDRPFKECSEYVCKSIGKNCQFTFDNGNPLCLSVKQNDVSSPIIKPLDLGYEVEKLPNGHKLVEKLQPYTPVTLGIETNERARCKYSTELNQDYNSKLNFFGDSSLEIEHELTFRLLPGGRKHIYYIRCEDYAENQNQQDYVIEFEIKPEPDRSPPLIENSIPRNNGIFKFGETTADVSLFLNEPASCKYSSIANVLYENMENSFVCLENAIDLNGIDQFICSASLTNLDPQNENRFYIKCTDTSGNVNTQDYVYILKGSEQLSLIVTPEGIVYDPEIILTVESSNKAVCTFNEISFLDSDGFTHTQPLMLPEGLRSYDIKCIDEAGNEATKTVEILQRVDAGGPRIVRIYQDFEILNLETDEEAICQYSNERFSFGSGKDMSTNFTKTHEATSTYPVYYVICQDKYDNISPTYEIYP